jgi:hypothetical protein
MANSVAHRALGGGVTCTCPAAVHVGALVLALIASGSGGGANAPPMRGDGSAVKNCCASAASRSRICAAALGRCCSCLQYVSRMYAAGGGGAHTREDDGPPTRSRWSERSASACLRTAESALGAAQSAPEISPGSDIGGGG